MFEQISNSRNQCNAHEIRDLFILSNEELVKFVFCCHFFKIFLVAKIMQMNDRWGVSAYFKLFLSIFVYGFQCVFGILKTTLGLVRWLLPHGLSWILLTF